MDAALETVAGTVRIHMADDGGWHAVCETRSVEDGIDEIRLRLTADEDLPFPVCTVRGSLPKGDVVARWLPFTHAVPLPPDWSGGLSSQLGSSLPMALFYNNKGENALAFAVSEAMRFVRFNAGISEADASLVFSVEIFTEPEAPQKTYTASIRLDARRIFYADAVRDMADWYASMPTYAAAPTPAAARELLYSTWYSYHKDGLYDHVVEAECARAASFGMTSVIVDDGWQADSFETGGYETCGDWEPSPLRFPDMRAHVSNIHALGMRYILWYAVPFAGVRSRLAERFQGKFLYKNESARAYVLDPRFPDVRDYLIGVWERAVREWDLDGFKLDFIDAMVVSWSDDPANKAGYGSRDCKTVPEGLDRLMTDALARLRRLKPDILVEFRQSYIGPAIRKYGNILRAGDCPSDMISNRMRTVNLRLTAGQTAVHSDMLEWHYGETVESAARQILNVLFSVPQISVRLAEIPPDHARMLRFWLGFWQANKEVLLDGVLKPLYPEYNYPLIESERGGERIVLLAAAACVVPVLTNRHRNTVVVNASETDTIIVDADAPCQQVTVQNVFGEPVATVALCRGLNKVRVPVSGFLRIS